jgi:TetR/AcrR family transcriptional repressor of nem operon
MRFEKGHKEATRQRIIDVASARFRKDGVAAVGIAPLMAEAGLTHGGFYAHFESKDELVREAMTAALAGTRRRLERAAERGDAGLEHFIRWYLTPAHRDAPERGCAYAAMAPEIARQSEATRAAFTSRLEDTVGWIAAQVKPNCPEAERRSVAIGIFGVMLGTLQLARTVTDPELSDQILASGVTAALALAA